MTEEKSQASWKNRRRMAWFSFLGLFMMVLGMLFHILVKDGDPTSWTGIMSTIIAVLGAIVVGYTGFAAWEDVKKNEKK